MSVQAGLCLTFSETPKKTGVLASRLNYFYMRDFDTNHRKITNAKGCGSICWDSTNVNGLE